MYGLAVVAMTDVLQHWLASEAYLDSPARTANCGVHQESGSDWCVELEGRELRGQRAFEGGTRFATGLISCQHRNVGYLRGVPHKAQHGRHEHIGAGELLFQIFA